MQGQILAAEINTWVKKKIDGMTKNTHTGLA